MEHCNIDRCIRKQSYPDRKDLTAWEIERNCPHKNTECPEIEKFNYKKNLNGMKTAYGKS
jgi:hypothetical protein